MNYLAAFAIAGIAWAVVLVTVLACVVYLAARAVVRAFRRAETVISQALAELDDRPATGEDSLTAVADAVRDPAPHREDWLAEIRQALDDSVSLIEVYVPTPRAPADDEPIDLWPADIGQHHADDAMLDRLAAGDIPDGYLARLLAAWRDGIKRADG